MKPWLLEQMAMYTAYHRDARNRASHFVGVPMITFSIFIMLSFVRFGEPDQEPITAAMLFVIPLLALYASAVPVLGLVSAVFLLPLLWGAERVTQQDPQTIWIISGVCFVGGWIIQLIGHMFEGRKPALTDNILQVFMAPGFLVAEVLFAVGLLSELKADLTTRSVKYDSVPD